MLLRINHRPVLLLPHTNVSPRENLGGGWPDASTGQPPAVLLLKQDKYCLIRFSQELRINPLPVPLQTSNVTLEVIPNLTIFTGEINDYFAAGVSRRETPGSSTDGSAVDERR